MSRQYVDLDLALTRALEREPELADIYRAHHAGKSCSPGQYCPFGETIRRRYMAEVRAMLEAEASRRGVSVEVIQREYAAATPVPYALIAMLIFWFVVVPIALWWLLRAG